MSADYVQFVPIEWGWLSHFRDGILASLNSVYVQKVELFCLAIYIAWFISRLCILQRALVQHSPRSTFILQIEMFRTALLVGFGSSALLVRPCVATNMPDLKDAVVLFWGLALGQGLRLVKRKRLNSQQAVELYENLLNALVSLLTLSVFVQPEWWRQVFQYHGEKRWVGIWRNPNNFGMLMGVGIVVASGFLVLSFSRLPSGRRAWWPWLRVAFYIFAVGCMGIGLLKSYSRGGWIGTLIGLAYLGYKIHRSPAFSGGYIWVPLQRNLASYFNTLARNRFVLSVIAVSLILIAFYRFNDTDNLVMRRAFSTGNGSDLSWRNRLVADEEALQMMASKPWNGYGWGNLMEVSFQFFQPQRLIEPQAILLNAFFTVGMTLGLPALVCLFGYVWLSLAQVTKLEIRNRTGSLLNNDAYFLREIWLRTVCCAGIIVLLVSFLFEGGLFSLPLTVPFWILLELGQENTSSNNEFTSCVSTGT